MNWDTLHLFLQEVFQPINEGTPPLLPQEFWREYSERIQQFDQDTLQTAFTDFGNGVWLPKAYEVARILYNLRQRRVMRNGIPNDGRFLVENMRIEVEARRRPIRNFQREELPGEMPEINRLLADIGGKPSYSRFQVDGWRITDSAISQRSGLVIVAPTGAGKTEVFLLPLIAHIATRLNNPSQVPHFILVYPRVALLKDQLSRILLYAYRASQQYSTGQSGLFDDTRRQLQTPIVVGLQYNGIRSTRQQTYENTEIFDSDNRFLTIDECPIDGCVGHLIRGNAQRGRGIIPLRCSECRNEFFVTLSREDHVSERPHILVTTLESLDNLYLNPQTEDFIQNIDGIVFDEVHLYNSLYGAHVANVIERVESFQQHGRPLVKIACSATVSNPERFAAKLFYKDENANVTLLDADTYSEMETAGLETIIFLQSPSGDDAPPPQATLLQTGMAIQHGALQPGNRTILFTESVDHVTRTKIQLYNAEVEQQLWRFRSVVEHIQFDGERCPQSDAFRCDVYANGECWRGVNGGVNCTMHQNIITRPLDIRAISSRNVGSVSDGDLVVASPSLEVGVDDPNFKSTIHYRTPFNVFSFIQRRGRAGRTGDDVAFSVMVLGSEANDEFYFRRRNRLINGANYELPLNPNNNVVLGMHQAMEHERLAIQHISATTRSKYDSKSLLLWLIGTYINCPTLNRLFGQRLSGIYRELQTAETWPQIQRQQENFRRWVDEQYRLLKQYLNIEIMLQELEARIPLEHQHFVQSLRYNISEYRAGANIPENEISRLLLTLNNYVANLLISQILSEREQRELQSLQQLIVNISQGYRLQQRLDIQSREIVALYHFFTVWYEKFNDPQYGYVPLNYTPQAIKLTLQTLYYSGMVCLYGQQCNSCVDFYIPNSYFQEVKPILVQALTLEELEHGGEGATVETEDSTKLASLLTSYKPFYRYSTHNEVMSILVTEHDPAWIEQIDGNQYHVGIQLRVDGLHQGDGSIVPRQIYVRPIQADNEGKNVLQLCTRCYRVHDEDTRQPCNCGGVLTSVKLYPQPLLERRADVYEQHQISENFRFCERLTGHTIIYGSEVTYKRMVRNQERGEYQPRTEDPVTFIARYRGRNGQPQPLKYSIATRGIVWDLNRIVASLLQNRHLQASLQEQEKELNRELILHTAAHMLYKAMSSLSGVSEYVLEYATILEENRVIIWERYEGGVGLSEIVRDLIRENPLTVYQELLYSVVCPVHLSNSVSPIIFSNESLKQELAERWALNVNDELIRSVVQEALAERQATINNQAEDEEGCADGCPACIHISMCTERGNQQASVSRLVAEQIIEQLIMRDIDEVQLEGIINARIEYNLSPDVEILEYNENRERYHVLCL